jgi:hypothetical protein
MDQPPLPPPLLPANGDDKIKIECAKCGQHFSVPMPPVEVSNNLRTSMIIAVHPHLIHCINARCRQAYTYVFGVYTVNISAMPVNDEAVAQVEGSRIIKPTLGLVQ